MGRKRGQPDRGRRKTKKRRRSLTGRLMRLVGRLIARHPSLAGGTAAFLVIFGFVSANAIWYQPGAIAHPLFATRDRTAHMAKATAAVKGARSGLTIEEVIAGLPSKAAAADPKPDASQQTGSIPARTARPAGDPLVRQIQTELAERQFYSGPIDGADDHKTRAAIEAFQAATGRTLTGEPSPGLLAEIRATHRDAVALPRSRPGDQPQAADEEVATIIAASAPAAAPALANVPTPKPRDEAPQNLVARIQTGLRNIAYTNVAVDGIAGPQTKAAIRNFEKNYRLPQTGEPSERVLDKLKAIGAL